MKIDLSFPCYSILILINTVRPSFEPISSPNVKKYSKMSIPTRKIRFPFIMTRKWQFDSKSSKFDSKMIIRLKIFKFRLENVNFDSKMSISTRKCKISTRKCQFWLENVNFDSKMSISTRKCQFWSKMPVLIPNIACESKMMILNETFYL